MKFMSLSSSTRLHDDSDAVRPARLGGTQRTALAGEDALLTVVISLKGSLLRSVRWIDTTPKKAPESQHARNYGRAAVGEFGTHAKTSRIEETKGPVYSMAGTWRKGCELVGEWNAWHCPGANSLFTCRRN